MTKRLTFDHYCVCQRDDGSRWELGRGATGVTFKAEDVNLLCPVALKVIDLNINRGEETRRALAFEARSAARLRHRNIATVYHLGMDPGHIFYAMEYVEGETAEALVMRRGPLAPEAALRIVSQVARALAVAHRHGIVHRDIKPANLMISSEHPDAEEGAVVKMIDFGLAHPVEAIAGRGFFGTPQYASPEQAEEAEVDTRSDVYSLGCTLWFLLSGEPPFTGPLAQVVTSKLRGELPWERVQGQSRAVKQLLRIMLRRNPEDRPRDPHQLLAAIEICLRSLAVRRSLAERFEETSTNLKGWAKPPRRRALLATGIALALILGTVISLPSKRASAGTDTAPLTSISAHEAPPKENHAWPEHMLGPFPRFTFTASGAGEIGQHDVESIEITPQQQEAKVEPQVSDPAVTTEPLAPIAEFAPRSNRPVVDAESATRDSEEATGAKEPEKLRLAGRTKRTVSRHHSHSSGHAGWNPVAIVHRELKGLLGRLF